MSFLLDTCVVSELVSRKPNRAVLNWIDTVDEHQLYLSAVTLGEIQRGIERAPDPQRKEVLQAWLTDELLLRFAGRIIELDIKTMMAWGELAGKLDNRGKPMPAIDALIAASCIHHGLTLVTRNVSDFQFAGIKVFNPWS
jgi:toxin FitB